MARSSMRMVTSFACVALVVLTGSTLPVAAQEGSSAPPDAPSGQEPYWLPVPAGAAVVVSQGNDTESLGGDHAGASRFAYDFESEDGTGFPVVASRGGVVQGLRSDVPDGNCPDTGQDEPPTCWTEVNYVVVDHLDGTAGLYLHLAQASSVGLAAGQTVEPSQPLGMAGTSGWTNATKLHFMVTDTAPAASGDPAWWRQSLGPIAFSDASIRDVRPDGIPGSGLDIDGPYVSGNSEPVVETSDGPPVARPPELPGRLPWAAGTSHTVRRVGDRNAPDGYGFDVASGDRGDVIDEDTEAFPLFGGAVVFAGCATGRSAPLGKTVVIERSAAEHTYQAVLSHLSSIEPGLSTDVSANEPIGTFGRTETSPDGSCDGGSGKTRLHVSLLRDAQVTTTGEIRGGRPVRAWPLLGAGAYDPVAWWKGPMEASDIGADTAVPTATWARGTTRDATHVPYGQSVRLRVRARDDGGLREVRLLAWHPDWAQRVPGKFRGLDASQTWRILAVCRPPRSQGVPGQTRDCAWAGDRRDATVTFGWQPTVVERRGRAPWLPPATAAITSASRGCVPVTFAFEVFDDSGHSLMPMKRKVAQRCDARASGLGRTVYLDPSKPPAVPTAAKIVCAASGTFGCDKSVIKWQQPGNDETGFRIYVEAIDYVSTVGTCTVKTRTGPWLVTTLPGGSGSWVVKSQTLASAINSALGPKEIDVEIRLSVSSFNPAGASARAKATGSISYLGDVFPC